MFRKILLPVIFLVLGYGFWLSPDFKEIAAGIAIFLFGMLSLEEGFKVFTGGLLEKLLQRTTDRIWKSLSFGIVSTSIMQSSSLVSVITISFLSAGLIPLIAGVGIVFGANLGTTTGAWLLAGFGLKVKISAYAMPMIVFGVILVFQRIKEMKGFGYILSGLGFLFLGIHHMKAGFEAFADGIDLAAYSVSGYPGVFLFVGLGIAATVVMQSSHATLVLILTALGAGQVTYENALALAIGANIGTTITAIIGSLGSNVEGRRLAGAHLIFNAVTALVAIIFIYRLAHLVDTTSSLLGISSDNHTLKLAVFHSIFNALGIIIMLPFLKPMVRFLERLLKPRRGVTATPNYLNEASTGLADTAIMAVRRETLHLYENAFEIICEALRVRPGDVRSDQPVRELVEKNSLKTSISIDEKYEALVKGLYSDIVTFASKTRSHLTEEQAEELYALRTAGRDIVEAIKGTKHLQKNLDRYMGSSHETVKAEYFDIRVRLVALLRQLEAIRLEGNDSVTSVSLDSLMADVEEEERQCDNRLDRLIRKEYISATIATSLMNDNSYTRQVSEKLVNMAGVLFAAGDLESMAAERSVLLDPDERTNALTQLKTRTERKTDHEMEETHKKDTENARP